MDILHLPGVIKRLRPNRRRMHAADAVRRPAIGRATAPVPPVVSPPGRAEITKLAWTATGGVVSDEALTTMRVLVPGVEDVELERRLLAVAATLPPQGRHARREPEALSAAITAFFRGSSWTLPAVAA